VEFSGISGNLEIRVRLFLHRAWPIKQDNVRFSSHLRLKPEVISQINRRNVILIFSIFVVKKKEITLFHLSQ